MPRPPRINTADTNFHVLNRANSKLKIFKQQIDYEDFIDLLTRSLEKYKIKLYTYIIMPTHWHFECSPQIDGELSRWMAWLQMMHTRKWHNRHKTIGQGHFYQGRFKSFIIQDDIHFLQVARYVERNALTAGLVQKAEDWPYSSLSNNNRVPISKWPIEKPDDYLGYVNECISKKELESLKHCESKGLPYGNKKWVEKIIKKNNLEITARKVGRPRKKLFYL